MTYEKAKKKGIIEFMSESKENITLRKALPWFLSERRGILQPNTESRTSQTSINHNNTSYTHSNKQSKYTRKSSTVLSRAQLSKPHKSNKSSSKTTHPNHFYIQYMIIHSKDWRTVATNHHPPSLLMPFLSFFPPCTTEKVDALVELLQSAVQLCSTISRTLLLYSRLFSLNMRAASEFAGEFGFGSQSRDWIKHLSTMPIRICPHR